MARGAAPGGHLDCLNEESAGIRRILPRATAFDTAAPAMSPVEHAAAGKEVPSQTTSTPAPADDPEALLRVAYGSAPQRLWTHANA